jgi:hypothetical protein
MPANYILLERVTLTANASSVVLDNIPQTGYTDLVVKFSARSDRVNVDQLFTVKFNGSSTTLLSRRVEGDGSTATSGTDATQIYAIGTGNSSTASTFGNCEIYIFNYTSNIFKSVLIDGVSETNATNSTLLSLSGLWSNTAAINSITLTPNGGQAILPNSSFSLYGIAAVGTTPVIAPKAAGGDIIVSDGTYWYHAFLSSGTFTPSSNLSCDYLVVAGGGGAGNSSNGAGGGAGGLRSTVTATGGGGSLESALSVVSGTVYPVTVGAGGAGSANGNNSIFSSITSIGGGYGGNGGAGSAGATGGSGGGVYNYPTYSAGSGTANQGFAGGNGTAVPPNYYAGGGGGAGAAGSSPNGGNGVQITALATPTGTGANSGYYAGGGAGAADAGTRGVGGLGGGGTGGLPQNVGGTAGTANTGGGGGGYPYAGGSGIVIVRYAI